MTTQEALRLIVEAEESRRERRFKAEQDAAGIGDPAATTPDPPPGPGRPLISLG